MSFFFGIIRNEVAFHQILYISSAHMARLRDESESTEAIALSAEAIRCINKRIVDPVLYISDNTLVEIIDFSCHVVCDF